MISNFFNSIRIFLFLAGETDQEKLTARTDQINPETRQLQLQAETLQAARSSTWPGTTPRIRTEPLTT